MNQTLPDGLDVLTAQQRESEQQLPSASESTPNSAPALLQLEATVAGIYAGEHFTDGKDRMELTFCGCDGAFRTLRLAAPAGAKLRDRYVVILSPVQCCEQREGER